MPQPTAGPLAGFTVPRLELPRPAVPLASGARTAAAMIIAAVARGATPEDVMLGNVPIVDDELERVEVLDFVDMLAAAVTGAAR